jgi:hypothetical protein
MWSRFLLVGAVRGDETPGERPDNIWQIDVTQGGRACVLPSQQLSLWRPSSSRASQITITNPAGVAISLNWPAEQKTLDLPSELQLRESQEYQLTWTGVVTPVRLTVRRVPEAAQSLEQIAAALVDLQCRQQIETLIASTSLHPPHESDR